MEWWSDGVVERWSDGISRISKCEPGINVISLDKLIR